MKHNAPSLFIFLIIILMTSSCSSRKNTAYSGDHFALGTICSVTLYERIEDFDFNEVFSLIDKIEAKMSIKIADSEISAVNASAGIKAVTVSPDTFELIRAGIKFSEASGGSFDITVGPLVSLWNIGTEDQRIPDGDEIEEAVQLCEFRDVELNQVEQSIFLKRKGMVLDPGGIAKGHAADAVREYLIEKGFSRGIINLGGNIITFGTKRDGTAWNIGIQDPENARGSSAGIVKTGKAAVVTSGIYERFFREGGQLYHHIIDTKTGYPVENNLQSVTIICESGITADALSTAVFLLGLKRGMEFIENRDSTEAIFITKERDIFTTSGLKSSFKVTSGKYNERI